MLAPFGEINLAASRTLTLASGSRSSTSGAGVTTVFGNSEFGTDWIYSLGDVVRVIDGSPEKRISLTAPDIHLSTGSLVDISGGGDLLTFEFVPGPGGRRDRRGIAPRPPADWTVMTRDLWQDFGDFTLTGIAPTAIAGPALFDRIELIRTLDVPADAPESK